MKRTGLKSIHSEPKTAFKLPLKREELEKRSFRRWQRIAFARGSSW